MPITRYPASDGDDNPISSIERLPAKLVAVLREAGLTDDEIRARDWEIHDGTAEFHDGFLELQEIMRTARAKVAFMQGAEGAELLILDREKDADEDLDLEGFPED
jgi:hypothetical protein